MKINHFIRSLMLSCLFVIIFSGSRSTAKDVPDKPTSIPSQLGAQTAKKQDPTLFISVGSLLHKLRQNQSILLVDIRSQKEFDKARIPGSINIPLYAVEIKAFLKSVPFVLVENGYRYKSLERQCATLRDEGFKASFLMGGLNGWKQRGGPLQGNAFEDMTFNGISPQAYYQERNHEEWIVIDASMEQTTASKELFPNALHIPVIEHADTAVLAITKGTRPGKSSPYFPLLVFNRDGNDYEKLENQIRKVGLENAFYLQGGLLAYKEFLNHLALSRKPKEQRLKTSRECGSCQKGATDEAEIQDH